MDYNGFIPSVGETFNVLNWSGSLTGDASFYYDPAFATEGIAFTSQWNANSLVLTATSAVPEPTTIILLLAAILGCVLMYPQLVIKGLLIFSKMFAVLFFFFVSTAVMASDLTFTPSLTLDPIIDGNQIIVSLPVDETVNEIKFDSTTKNFILEGPGKLILSGDIDVASGNFDSIDADLSGDITKIGDGFITLSHIDDVNSLIVEGGIVNITNPASIGTLTVGAGATAMFTPEPGTFILLFVVGVVFFFFFS